MREGYTTISSSVPKDFAKDLKRFAMENDMSISLVIRKALVEYMDKINKK